MPDTVSPINLSSSESWLKASSFRIAIAAGNRPASEQQQQESMTMVILMSARACLSIQIPPVLHAPPTQR
jgi:hypothetical protein